MTGTALAATVIGLSCRMTSGQQDNRKGYLPFRGLACANAEAATDFESLPNLLSVRIFEAFDATFGEVCFRFLTISITSSALVRHATDQCVLMSVRAARSEIMGTLKFISPIP